jgi:hypothetical protein
MCHILEHVDSLGSLGEHEARLTSHKVCPSNVNVLLIHLKLGSQCGNVIVELSIVDDLPSQPLVVGLGDGHL